MRAESEEIEARGWREGNGWRETSHTKIQFSYFSDTAAGGFCLFMLELDKLLVRVRQEKHISQAGDRFRGSRRWSTTLANCY